MCEKSTEAVGWDGVATRRYGPFASRQATAEDAAHVALNLRDGDKLDLEATTRPPADELLLLSLHRAARAVAYDWEDETVAVGGVRDFVGLDASMVWLLGTPKFDVALRRGGLRVCREWLADMAEGRPRLFNVVPASNKTTLRWLQHLGFRRGALIPNYLGLGHNCYEMQLVRPAAA